MSDLKKYIVKRKSSDIEFMIGYEEGYANFKLQIALKQSRKKIDENSPSFAQSDLENF